MLIHIWRHLQALWRHLFAASPGVAPRITFFAGVSLVAAAAASVTSILFAYDTQQSVGRLLHDSKAAGDTVIWLHKALDQERHIIRDDLAPADGAGRADAGFAAAALVTAIGDCLAAEADCVSPPAPLAAAIDTDFATLAAATQEAVRHAGLPSGQFAAAGARFSAAADNLDDRIDNWQDRQLEELLRQIAAVSARAGRTARNVAASTALLLLVGLLGFVVVWRVLGRLRRLTVVMLAVARGETGPEIPFATAPDEVGRMAQALIVFLDTARRLQAREADLRSVNIWLDAALNNMSQGLCMFDAGNRLVLCNRRAREIIGLAADVTPEGLTCDEFVDLFVVQGSYRLERAGQMKERLRANAMRRVAASYVRELADGRSIAHWTMPVPDGGWVITFEDITERRAAEARIAHMAHHDALTGLANRTLFLAALQAAASGAGHGPGYALHYLDLDRFKDVNDTLGHTVGDALLCAITLRLREVVRETDLVARLGGDEFAIIQQDASQPGDAAQFAQRIIAAFAPPFGIDGHRVVISASVGIALASDGDADSGDLLRRADLALYHAKADGCGTYRFFEPGMNARLQARRSLEVALGNALANGEFEMHYQAQVSLATRETLGFEALLRWHSPEHGLVSPARFIPIAEDSGLIVAIGEWVLRQTCADAATWPEQLSVAVNLSAVQFRSAGLMQIVRSALAQSGLAPQRLELEITESALLHRSDRTLETLHDLRALGVRITMDDFGTGYSSLSYLHRFPFSKIKIDQSFVRGLGRDEGCEAIIRAVIGLGVSFGIETIAEGIETEAQLQQVCAQGGTEGQGYLFSRPLPLAHLQPLLSRAVGHPPGKVLCLTTVAD